MPRLKGIRRVGRLMPVVLVSCIATQLVPAREPADRAVLQVDYPFPTADKPQSKTWFSHGTWWAVLPRLGGPSLWQRRESGWMEHVEVRAALAGLPGRADVWWDEEGATAAAAADRIVRVFRLTPADPRAETWRAQVLATCYSPASDAIETITIARDGHGQWWLAAVVQEKVYVWQSTDASRWPKPQIIGASLEADDICAVTPLATGVGVVWSDQRADAVKFRVHRNGDPLTTWQTPEVVQSGQRTADDHLHTALAADGTLWVASKNSVDQIGRPQFVLRSRPPGGGWHNFPYAPLPSDATISRPVIVLGAAGELLMGHTVYHRKSHSEVVFARVDSTGSLPAQSFEVVIAPERELHTRVVDLTVPKRAYPPDAPWVVLGSDGAGRVFEGDLRSLRAR